MNDLAPPHTWRKTGPPLDRYGGRYVTDEAGLLHEIRDTLQEIRNLLLRLAERNGTP